MLHIFFFLGNYLFRMSEIHAQYNWIFPLHMLFFHIFSMYVYGLKASAKQGHACLTCTISFPVHVAMSSLHESRSRHLLTLSHAVHPSVEQKHENRAAPDQEYRGMGSTVQPNLAIAFWVRNVCQTQTPFSQTTTAALSVGRPCTYTHMRNKHQCCYISIFTLLSLSWNEKKMWGINF